MKQLVSSASSSSCMPQRKPGSQCAEPQYSSTHPYKRCSLDGATTAAWLCYERKGRLQVCSLALLNTPSGCSDTVGQLPQTLWYSAAGAWLPQGPPGASAPCSLPGAAASLRLGLLLRHVAGLDTCRIATCAVIMPDLCALDCLTQWLRHLLLEDKKLRMGRAAGLPACLACKTRQVTIHQRNTFLWWLFMR